MKPVQLHIYMSFGGPQCTIEVGGALQTSPFCNLQYHSYTAWRWQATSTRLTPFVTFSNPVGSLFMPNSIPLTPSLCKKKIGLSLSHLVPEIIWPKFGLIFHQICNLTTLGHFVPIFSLIFNLVVLFFIVLRSFDLLFFQNLRSDWVHFSSSRSGPPPPIYSP